MDLGIDGIVDAELIGSGGFSSVYRARQSAFDRVVAVKVLSTPIHDEGTARRFRREMALTGRLSGHAGVARLYDAGTTREGLPYLVMEFHPGGSLADLLKEGGALPIASVLSIGVTMCGALAAAHSEGVLHRDVKPANILLDTYGDPVLSDFGIAGLVSGETQLTAALTLQYAAPETIDDDAAASEWSDQYSLGMTLTALMLGRSPWASVGRRVRAETPVEIDATAVEVLARATNDEPENRWPSMIAFGEALQECQVRLGLPKTVLRVGAPVAGAELVDRTATAAARQASDGPDDATRRKFVQPAESTESPGPREDQLLGQPHTAATLQAGGAGNHSDEFAVGATARIDRPQPPLDVAAAQRASERGKRTAILMASAVALLAAASVTAFFATRGKVEAPPPTTIAYAPSAAADQPPVATAILPAASAPAAATFAPSVVETPQIAPAVPTTGTALYLVDGNTGNSLGRSLPAGTLEGVKGTIPGAEVTPDFRSALLGVEPGLVDFAYAPESYDAVVLAALGAAAAQSDAGVDMAKQLVAITNGTDVCNDYAGCLELLKQGRQIAYNGRSGATNFWDTGDVTRASIGIYTFGADNLLRNDVTFLEGEIAPTDTGNPIDGVKQRGAGDGVFKVGTFLPFTGSLAFLGPPQLAGVKLAIRDIEAAGGIRGFNSIVLEDGDSGDVTTDTGQRTVKRLLPKNIDVLVGAASSSSTLSVLDQVTNAGVLMISPSNTSPKLTSAPDHGLYWRTSPSDVLQGQFLGSLVVQDGHDKVAIMSLRDAYGDGLSANIAKAVTEGGGSVAVKVVYDPAATEFSAEIAKVKAAGPDAIVLIGFEESAQVIQELVKQGIGPNSPT